MIEFPMSKNADFLYAKQFININVPLLIQGESYKGFYWIRYLNPYEIKEIRLSGHFNEKICVNILRRCNTSNIRLEQVTAKVSSDGVLDLKNILMEPGNSLIMLTSGKSDPIPNRIRLKIKKTTNRDRDKEWINIVRAVTDGLEYDYIDFRIIYGEFINRIGKSSTVLSGFITYEELLRVVHGKIEYEDPPEVVPLNYLGCSKPSVLKKFNFKDFPKGKIVFDDDTEVYDDPYADRLVTIQIMCRSLQKSFLYHFTPNNHQTILGRYRHSRSNLTKYLNSDKYVSEAGVVQTKWNRIIKSAELSFDKPTGKADSKSKSTGFVDSMIAKMNREYNPKTLSPEKVRLLRESFSVLSPKQLTIVHLLYNKGYSPRKIAEVIEMPPNTVYETSYSGIKSLFLYYNIASLREECKDENDEHYFDWYTFFERRYDIFSDFEAQLFGTLLEHGEEIETFAELIRLSVGVKYSNDSAQVGGKIPTYNRSFLSQIKRKADFLHIDPNTLNTIHHLFEDSRDYVPVQDSNRARYFAAQVKRWYMRAHPNERNRHVASLTI